MLKFFEARGINKRISVPPFEFDPGINLLTGMNGSGKTTILKLLWYLVSGNLERIPQEITFDYIRLVTSDFEIILDSTAKSEDLTFTLKAGEHLVHQSMPLALFSDEPPPIREANQRTATTRSSVFFPTFRRMEGGFSLSRTSSGRTELMYRQTYNAIEQALSQMSSQLSVLGHQFVCSISTSDIVRLLTARYADISQRTNSEQSEFIKNIIAEIERQDQLSQNLPQVDDAQLLMGAHAAINKIRKTATKYGRRQEELLQPFTTLSKFIETVFADKGISISGGLELGVGKEKISSDLLSAGEKQILSFLVYNAFLEKVPIFIDEPEISLHVDWQRILFPTLLEQKTGNQFIVATHSPFIYSKYSDKEIKSQRLDEA